MQEEYTRVKPVDKERMSKYLEAAKGPGRTMKQFAEECGVNPSTFSRIVNKKLGGASTETVIRSIFEHRDRTSGITLEMLMDANGFASAEEVRLFAEKCTGAITELTSMAHKVLEHDPNKIEQFEDMLIRKQTASRSVMKELMRRAPDTIFSPLHRVRVSKTRVISIQFLYRNEIIGGNGQWGFEFLQTSSSERIIRRFGVNTDDADSDEIVKQRRKFENGRSFYENFTRRYAALTYFKSDEVPQRISYVVDNSEAYEDILEDFGEQKFQGYVSLLLVDLKEEKVTNEFVFPRQDGGSTEKFFSAPFPSDLDDDVNNLVDIDEIPF